MAKEPKNELPELEAALRALRPNAPQTNIHKAALVLLGRDTTHAPVKPRPTVEPHSAVAVDASSLPEKAPKLYAERSKGQNIIDFLRDPNGWHPYVVAGLLSRPDLKRLDPKAYKALENWLLHNPLPDDVRLPKKADLTDRLVAQHPNAADLPPNVLSALRSRQTRKLRTPET